MFGQPVNADSGMATEARIRMLVLIPSAFTAILIAYFAAYVSGLWGWW